jgi:hypothetical protein
MSLDVNLSPGEEAYIASRGQSADALVAENPELPAGYSDERGFHETGRFSGEPSEADAQNNALQEPGERQSEGHPKRVTYNKFRQAQERIAQLESENRARAEREVVLDERLRLIKEA